MVLAPVIHTILIVQIFAHTDIKSLILTSTVMSISVIKPMALKEKLAHNSNGNIFM